MSPMVCSWWAVSTILRTSAKSLIAAGSPARKKKAGATAT
jgi:hypothetical protein